MIDDVDRKLREWVSEVTAGVEAVLTEPSFPAAGTSVISLYLCEILESPPPRTTSRPPLQVNLRYLITSWSPDPEEAHRRLGQLLFAAMDNREFQVDLTPVSPAVWAGFGIPPRPSFGLLVPFRQTRHQPLAKPVLQPLVVQQSPVRPLRGRVLGPGEIPLMGARVELPGIGKYTRTDARGFFSFAQVPTDPAPAQIEVKARGRQMRVDLSPAWSDEERPLLIRFQLTEV